MNQRFPIRTVLLAASGYVTTVGTLQLYPHDPPAELPEIARAEGALEAVDDLEPERAPGELRIFVAGASVATGYPYRPALLASYATQLEVGLQSVFRGCRIVCRPVAKSAVASPQLAVIVEGLLRVEPSLVFVCLGENEFSDRLFFGSELVPEGLGRLEERLVRARLLWQQLSDKLGGSSGQTEEEAQKSILDRVRAARPGKPAFGALPVSKRDQDLLVLRMRVALRRMASACARAGVPLVFGLAAHNLQGAWPRQGARGPEIDALVERARRGEPRLPEQLQGLQRSATLRFLEGLSYRRAGDPGAARRALLDAVDLDGMPMHMTRALAAALRAEAEAAARPCLDMNAPLADSTGLPDPRYFLDHAHLTVEGHARTAVYLAERLSALGLVPALPHGWREAFEKALRAHNARFDERTERAAASEMRMSSGTFFLLFGNFREALPELTGAFESGATGVIEQDADLALKLMFCAYALAGQQDAWERLPEGRRRHHAGELYAEMLAARDRGELGSFVREIAAGRRGVPAER